jgi:alpha,alpha-trehalase
MTFFIVYFFGLVFSQKIPTQCSIYCDGEILKAIQEAGIFVDSKTFVDMPMKNDPEVVLDAFRQLENNTIPNLSRFLREQFLIAGSEILSWTPSDWVENPNFIEHMNSEQYKEYARQVNTMWKSLGKQLVPDVLINPQRYSIIPQKYPFIVPGERFHEFYYWDSYWIIKGLLTSGMNITAKGIILNALDLIKEYGFIPNGARVYYLTRSQPPLLSEMVRYYYDYTQDMELLREAVPILDKEYKYWMKTHSVNLPGGYSLNRFFSDSDKPRPESYREDVHSSKDMSESEAKTFFANIIAGAESGQDFTSRWFTQGSDLRTISTTNFIPVDLNSMMYRFETNMLYFHDILGMDSAINFHQAVQNRREAMDRFLWNSTSHQWHDYCLTNSSQITRAYPSNWLPIWAGAYNTSLADELLESLKNSNLIQEGGVLTTHLDSGEQWDNPNIWAPHQSLTVEVLEQLGTTESLKLAETLAHRWLKTTYLGYQATQMMHEKYNAFIPGAAGSGGEYPPQIGFGWTNGVTLELLALYG